MGMSRIIERFRRCLFLGAIRFQLGHVSAMGEAAIDEILVRRGTVIPLNFILHRTHQTAVAPWGGDVHRDDHLGVAVTGELDIQGRTRSPVGHFHAACFQGGQFSARKLFRQTNEKITASKG